MTNGQGLAWLGFWLMLGLWNVNLDINLTDRGLAEIVFKKELIEYIEKKEAEVKDDTSL